MSKIEGRVMQLLGGSVVGGSRRRPDRSPAQKTEGGQMDRTREGRRDVNPEPACRTGFPKYESLW